MITHESFLSKYGFSKLVSLILIIEILLYGNYKVGMWLVEGNVAPQFFLFLPFLLLTQVVCTVAFVKVCGALSLKLSEKYGAK